MGMKYMSAYAMAYLAGNESPSEADVTKILEAGGIEVDAADLKVVISSLEGKNIPEMIAAGMSKLEKLGGGGGGGGGGGAAAGGAAAGGGAAEEKKEEKKVEEEEEEEMDFDLFG